MGLKRRPVLTLILHLSFVFIGFADPEIDSLTNLLYSATREDRISLLNRLAFLYRLNEPDKTIELADEALRIAESLNNLNGKYHSLSNLGLGHRYKGNYYEAMVFQQKALDVALKLQIDTDIVQEYNRIGIIYKGLGLYNDALEYFLKAITLLEKNGDTNDEDIANLYNNIGNVYRKRGDYELALECFFKTLKINKTLGNKEGYAYILNNIGNIYADLEIYDQALEYHKQSLEVKKELGNKYGISTSMKNIGDIYLAIKNPDKALDYFRQHQQYAVEINDKNGIASSMHDIGSAYIALKNYTMAEEYLYNSLKIKTEIGDKIGIINSYVSLSNFYIQINKYLEALKYLDKAYILAKDENFLEDLRDIYLNYSIVYNKIFLYDKALEYYQKYSTVKDSIFNTGISNKITQLQIKQKSEELEKEKLLLEEKNRFQQLLIVKKNQFIYLLIAFSFLILVTIILIYGRYRHNKKANRDLEEMNKSINGKNIFLQVLMDTIPNPMYYTDRSGVFIGCNRAFKEIHRLGSEDIIGKTMFHLYPMEFAEKHQKNDLGMLASQGIRQYETKLAMPDGQIHDIIYYKNTYQNSAGEVAGLVGIMLDITDRKKVEDKIKRSEKQLRNANVAKDKFFSIIAHDLKNPFNAILGFSGLLNTDFDKYNDKEKKTIIANLYNASENTSKLLQNLLEWAKTQTGNIEFRPETLEMKELIEENISILSTVAERKKIRINSDVSEKIHAFGDRNMVNTILRNLISNALKFTHDGGQVNIHSTLNENGVEFCVSDNGVGIKEDEIPKLFSLDNHFQMPGTANESGSGLGLILCREFVEKNGGRIWVESIQGKGSNFYFTLPGLVP
ncbi:MAG: tetratricopeptide repeat protein, partial [Bacteroidetes bacterium]|nr:tetratricopeptide repeat protein [Bacteroidota bacterium]